MPPEPFPWDRKDFLKERKNERSESFGSVARWRDSSHHARDIDRWGPGESRRLPGHGRQRGWHMFSEESGHEFGPSWTSGHKMMLEDDRGIPSVWRGEGKHGRNGRESRSFSQRDLRGHAWGTSNGQRNSVGRSQYDVINDHKSANCNVTFPSAFGNTCNEIKPKDLHDKIQNANGSSTGQKYERQNSPNTSDWKPIKWTRTAILSSQGSGFSNSRSSKNLEVLGTNEAKSELLWKNGSFIHPPPSDIVVCAMSSPPSEDTNSRKKPRLGWGEGLAKYEKKKVEDPDVCISKDAVFSHSAEISHSLGKSLADKNPVPVCASPATPPSVACSSSPVVDEKSFGKTFSADTNLCSSSSRGQGSLHLEGFSYILERIKELDTSSFANLGSLLTELLQPNAFSSEALDFVRSAAIDKLLFCKSEISKELELTESEIDSLENELKLVISRMGDSGSSIPPSATPFHIVSDSIVQSDPLQTVSQSIALSEPVLPLSQARDVSSPDAVNYADLYAIDSAIVSRTILPQCSILEETGLSLEVEADSLVFDDDENDHAVGNDTYCDSITVSNRELAESASEVFNQLLAGCKNKVTNKGLKSEKLLEAKFARRKQYLKFEERVLGLKFNAFQHPWKEMHLLSMRKPRTKPQKFSLRATNSRNQKNQSSTSFRVSSPGGNVSFGTRAEIVDFAGKLLPESPGKVYRNILKMPALILDKNEKMASKFISSNGLVEDPGAVEKERSMINPWTSEEREIFMDKFALFGKDFGKIASFLDHKTTADCVEFYYKNHKTDEFPKRKKKRESGKNKKWVTSMYLVTVEKRWNCEMNSAYYLNMLGAASEMVACANDKRSQEKRCSSQAVGESKTPWKDDWMSDQSRSLIGNEKEVVAADVLAGICGSLSSEAMSSCITSSIDPAEGYQKSKSKNVSSVVKQRLPYGTVLQTDDETCSDESCGQLEPFDWTDEEKSRFVQAVSTYGKDFVMISKCVRTRSVDQCKVFFSKARKCLGLDLMMQARRNHGTSVSGDDGKEGGSDIEDACILETGSFTSGDKFCSKMDEDSQKSDSSVLLTNQWRQEENCESSTLNHRDARISGGFDVVKEKYMPLTRVRGVEGSKRVLGENVAKICSESLVNVLGEQNNVKTHISDWSDFHCLVQVSSENGNLVVPSKDPWSIPSERDEYSKVTSNHRSIKRVASSNIPIGNSRQMPNKRLNGDYYLKSCCTRPQCASNEPTFQCDEQETMCRSNRNVGNVKLFGKILNHASSLQKSNVGQNEKEETASLRSKSDLTENDHKLDGNMGFLNFDHVNHMEHDKLWRNYETREANAANPILPGTFAFTTRGRDDARLSPFTAETKHGKDISIEIQRRNCLVAISSSQVGLSGGSDHVVATKMHHAKAGKEGESLEDRS